MSNKLIRVRDDHVLEVLDTQGRTYAEVRPGYTDALGPCIHIHRIGMHGDSLSVMTFRLESVSALVRKLPIVISAARRLQNGASKTAR